MKAARFALRQIQSDRAHFAHEPLIGGLQHLHLGTSRPLRASTSSTAAARPYRMFAAPVLLNQTAPIAQRTSKNR
jgi:hypothetical protein